MNFFDFNYKAVNWPRGLWTTLVAVGAVLLIFLTGQTEVVWAGIGGMAIGLIYFNAPLETRLRFGFWLTIFGMIILGLLLQFGGTTLSNTLLLTLVVFAIGIMQSLGGPFIVAGFLMAILAYNAVFVAGGGMDKLWAMGTYALGGLIAMVVVTLISAFRGPPQVEAPI